MFLVFLSLASALTGGGVEDLMLSGAVKVFIPSQPSFSLSLFISAVNTLSCNTLSIRQEVVSCSLNWTGNNILCSHSIPISEWSDKWNWWVDFTFSSPPVALVLLRPLTVFLVLPLSLKRSFWSWDYTLKKRGWTPCLQIHRSPTQIHRGPGRQPDWQRDREYKEAIREKLEREEGGRRRGEERQTLEIVGV